jgi:hypothetical protein
VFLSLSLQTTNLNQFCQGLDLHLDISFTEKAGFRAGPLGPLH